MQRDDGSFDLGKAKNPAPIAVTALSALALLGTGHVPGRSRFGDRVERAVHYLIQQQDKSGEARDGYFGAESDEFSQMHGHGYATLALAQVLGMLRTNERAIVTQEQARKALTAAVRLIERCQDRSGGWYYDPVPRGHEGSMTICMVQALRAAKNAGIVVNKKTIERALVYVDRSQKRDGSFRYSLGDEKSSLALTAAAIMTLNASGDWNSKVLAKGMSFLLDQSSHWNQRGLLARRNKRFPYYERLYLGQALFSAREQKTFWRWFPAAVEDLESTRSKKTKRWSSPNYGEAYATAMSLLVACLPLQYLPIYQR